MFRAGADGEPCPPPGGGAAGSLLRRPVAPMLAAPVDQVPEGPDVVHDRQARGQVAGIARHGWQRTPCCCVLVAYRLHAYPCLMS
ncbi:hypothetical protein FXF53_25920 [Micromonospora sp. WP24]|nr:hypothetical protein FXF53_25920 [Micromonospora sp. WP24]